jgi:mRNA interferase MazF
MDLRRGAIWWADLGEPLGSEPGYRRPVLIVQDDRFNESNLATVIVLALTSNLKYGMMPGNVLLTREQSGLAKDSIANATQLITIDKRWLDEYVEDVPTSAMRQIEHGLRAVLGL